MHPNIDRCLPALRRIAGAIGWADLAPNHDVVDGLDVVWYVSGDNVGDASDLFLQINEFPIGNTETFSASVFATRHSIWTGWHAFPFPKHNEEMGNTIELIDGWLNRIWFTDKQLRTKYCDKHPECCGFDWDRITNSKPPHEP